jgi:dTDP-glucose 4,6-dehydratase
LSINASDRLGDDPERRQPDITRAKTILGWEPRVSIREGLAQTIEYMRAKLALQGK